MHRLENFPVYLDYNSPSALGKIIAMSNDGTFPDASLWKEVLDTCGSFQLRRASRSVTQLYDDILQPVGLRSTQVVILVMLALEEEMGLARLARELVLSPSTLSRTLRPLQRDGLVSVANTGRRGKSARLTQHGRETLLAVVPYWQRAQQKFVEQVGEEDWRELAARLGSTVSAIRR